MSLAAFVITYRRPETLRAAVAALQAQTRPPEEILVVDNAGSSETSRIAAAGGTSVTYRNAGDNLGPAGAAALALGWARERGFEWTYWGDDDNPPATVDTLERLLALEAQRPPAELGAVAAAGARWDWRTGRLRRPTDDELSGVLSLDVAGGGSQLLVARAALDREDPPRAELFFGWEDLDYCLRLRRAGLEILVDGELMREYRRRTRRLGLDDRRRWSHKPPQHRLWRQYYSARNYIHLMRRAFGRPDLARRETVRVLARSLVAWAHGPRHAAQVARFQLRGVADGYRDRLGRTVEPGAATDAEAAAKLQP